MAVTGITFSERRNMELSFLNYITTQIDASWTNVTVVKTFKEVFAKNVKLPVICVEQDNVNSVRRELGSTTLEKRHLLSLDIFVTSEAMRLDLADFILNQLETGWVYNAYARTSGSQTELTGTPDGRVTVTDFLIDQKVDAVENSNPRERYRHTISVNARRGSQ